MTALDPVCGMTVDPEKARFRAEHGGETYFFCSAGCLEKFRAQPERYVGGGAAAGEHAAHPVAHRPSPPPAARTEWTCPMHPEVVRDRPGICPICGMALEPRVATGAAGEEENPELRDMTRRFWVSALLTLPLVVLAMGMMLPGDPFARLLPHRALGWLELLLATPVVLWGGWPFFVRGWYSLVHRSPQHVHADRPRRRRGLRLQPRRAARARALPRRLPRRPRPGRRLLRGGGGDRHPRPARSGAGAAGAEPHRRRDPGAPRPGAEDGAPAPRRRGRGGRAARRGAGRRPPARPPRREGAGRRRRRARG